MLVSLPTTAQTLTDTAETFFDSQYLYDIKIQSTLGLTEADCASLAQLPEIEESIGTFEQTLSVTHGGAVERVALRNITASHMNDFLIREGRFPAARGEIIISEKLQEAGDYRLGDTIHFPELEDASSAKVSTSLEQADAQEPRIFSESTYTIVGIGIDPLDVNKGKGLMAFRGGEARFSAQVSAQSVEAPAYTTVYVRVRGTRGLSSYGTEYRDAIAHARQALTDQLERLQARRGIQVRASALQHINHRRSEVETELATQTRGLTQREQQLRQAETLLREAEQSTAVRLDRGRERLLAEAMRIETSDSELREQRVKLEAKRREIDQGLEAVAQQLQVASEHLDEYFDQQFHTYTARIAELQQQRRSYAQRPAYQPLTALLIAGEQLRVPLQNGWDDELTQYVQYTTQALDLYGQMRDLSADPEIQHSSHNMQVWTDELHARMDALIAQLPDAHRQDLTLKSFNSPLELLASIETEQVICQDELRMCSELRHLYVSGVSLQNTYRQVEELRMAHAQIEEGLHTIAHHEVVLHHGREELFTAQRQLARTAAESRALFDQRAKALLQGTAQMSEGMNRLKTAREEAYEQLSAAELDVARIEDPRWYIQDRSDAASHESVRSDTSAIYALATMLPLLFVAVAILVSVTTVTRLIEEERHNIGIYKALGYRPSTLMGKYLFYTLSACGIGCLVGWVLGSTTIPLILMNVYLNIYAFPSFSLAVLPVQGLYSAVALLCGIALSSLMVTWRCVHIRSAELLIPPAPAPGTRIFLEYLPFLWSRMTFLTKVSARNMFRYKKRLIMTLTGIAGCVALLIMGFAIQNTVHSLAERQYGSQGIVSYDALIIVRPDDFEAIRKELLDQTWYQDSLIGTIDQVHLTHADKRVPAELFIVDDVPTLRDYVQLSDDAAARLGTPEGVLLSASLVQSASLGADEGYTIQASSLDEAYVSQASRYLSYLGDTMYVTTSTYQSLFRKTAEHNMLLVRMEGNTEEKLAIARHLSEDSRIVRVVSTQKLLQSFGDSLSLVQSIVYTIGVLAALLSCVVVFTLTSTNIAERTRELATIKVLGFRPREVRRYINREIYALTVMGIMLGIPLGHLLAQSLREVLILPAMYFDVVIYPESYVIASIFTLLCTAVVVTWCNASLDRINMIEALKSVE